MGLWEKCKSKSSEWVNRFALKPDSSEEEFEMYNYGNRGAIGMRSPLIGRRSSWRERLRPTKEQWTILILLGGELLLISIISEFTLGRLVLWPFAIISTIFHEFGHAIACWMTGARMGNIQIKMDESGDTRFVGGWFCAIVPAGYIGSTLIGALLVFMAFGVKTSRYTAIGVALILLFTLYYSVGVFTVVSSIGLLVLLLVAYRYKEGAYTRHFILFLGAISSTQAINSILNSTVFNTIKGSDAYVFAHECSILIPAFVYGFIWFVISLALLAASVLAALIFFKRNK
jgi:hypothetical protein